MHVIHNRLREQHARCLKFDSLTGQKLFTPQILRGPKVPRENIDEMLEKKSRTPLEVVEEASEKKRQGVKRNTTREFAKNAAANVKRRMFRRIFDELDVNKDGFVTPKHIDTSSKSCYMIPIIEIPEDMLLDFMPAIIRCQGKEEEEGRVGFEELLEMLERDSESSDIQCQTSR